MIKEYSSVILNRLSKHDKHKRFSRVSSKPVVLLKTIIILLGFVFLVNPAYAYLEESENLQIAKREIRKLKKELSK